LLCGRPFFSLCVVSCLLLVQRVSAAINMLLILTARLVGDVWWNVGIRMLLVCIWICCVKMFPWSWSVECRYLLH
jgi:hypothetical protein